MEVDLKALEERLTEVKDPWAYAALVVLMGEVRGLRRALKLALASDARTLRGDLEAARGEIARLRALLRSPP